jgi:hypothetical protein
MSVMSRPQEDLDSPMSDQSSLPSTLDVSCASLQQCHDDMFLCVAPYMGGFPRSEVVEDK